MSTEERDETGAGGHGRGAVDRLMALAYHELRQLAHGRLLGEPTGHSLDTTALVHETYLRLAGQRAGWRDKGHFLAIAALAMRRVLVDHARRYRAARRGGESVAPARMVPLDLVDLPVPERAELLVALDEALERLAQLDPRLAQVVECRFFAGLSEDDTADALGVSRRTVARDWVLARGWLQQAIGDAHE